MQPARSHELEKCQIVIKLAYLLVVFIIVVSYKPYLKKGYVVQHDFFLLNKAHTVNFTLKNGPGDIFLLNGARG